MFAASACTGELREFAERRRGPELIQRLLDESKLLYDGRLVYEPKRKIDKSVKFSKADEGMRETNLTDAESTELEFGFARGVRWSSSGGRSRTR